MATYTLSTAQSVEWHFGSKIDSQFILATAARIGVTFPDDYFALCQNADGGCPEPEVFHCGDDERVFGRLLSHDPSSREWIMTFAHAIRDRLPSDVYPFAIGPSGDFLCFDFRISSKPPAVVYWNHERAHLDGSLILVATTFHAMIASLYDDVP